MRVICHSNSAACKLIAECRGLSCCIIGSKGVRGKSERGEIAGTRWSLLKRENKLKIDMS